MAKKYSFTLQVKEEIVSKPFTQERIRSMLSAYIKINGVVNVVNNQKIIALKTENSKIAKFIYKTIKESYDVDINISYVRSLKLTKKVLYKINIIDPNEVLLNELDIDFFENKINKSLVKTNDLVCGYMAGAFIASGSVNSPTSSNYHLEISLSNERFARWFIKLILRYNDGAFDAKIVQRRDKYIVYLKKSDQIADFLILLGATDSCIEFENVRVDREFSNIGNRLQILDSANFNKAMKAAKEQIADIKKLDKIIGINNLTNVKLRELCKIRLIHEESTLQELADLLSLALHQDVSKSNINHLFRALRETVAKL